MKLFQVTVVLLGLLAGIDAASVHSKTRHLRTGNFAKQFVSNGGTRIELLQGAPAKKVAAKASAKPSAKASSKASAKASSKASGSGSGSGSAIPDLKPESAMVMGQFYALCWSINIPLATVGIAQIDAEIDVNAAIDFQKQGAKNVLDLSASVSGYISFTVGLSFLGSVKLIVMLTLSVSLEIETTKPGATPLAIIKMVMGHVAKEAAGQKDKNQKVDKSAIEVMDIAKTEMGVEHVWMGFRKIRQGFDKPDTLTNSLVRQSLVWDNSLRNGLLDDKGVVLKDPALAAKITLDDFKTGAAIPKLMGITLGATIANVPCKVWDVAFEADLKAKKKTIMVGDRKLRARRPSLLCKILYTYGKMQTKATEDVGLLLFPKVAAKKKVEVADVIADLDAAFSEANGNGSNKGLFDYLTIWAKALPAVKNEIIEAMNAATAGLAPDADFTIKGTVGLSLGVSVEIAPPNKKCDMATFTLGFTAGWSIEFPSKQVTAIKSIEVKYSMNPTGASIPTFKGVIFAESPLFQKNGKLGMLEKVGINFEFDGGVTSDVSTMAAQIALGTGAAAVAETKMGALVEMLTTLASGGAAKIATHLVKGAVAGVAAAAVSGTGMGLATANTFVIDAVLNNADNTIEGGISSVFAVDFNLPLPPMPPQMIPGGGIGGTYSQGKRMGFKIDATKTKKIVEDLWVGVFGGKPVPDATNKELLVEAGAPNAAVCQACTNTIMDKLNHQSGRGKCSAYEDAADYATCKLVKEELEAAYVISGFTDKNKKWGGLSAGRGSSTWQTWEPLFRSKICGVVTGKESDKDFMKYQHATRAAKPRNVVTTFDATSKADYCNNVASAADKMDKLNANQKVVAEMSWRGFCRGFGFCPDRGMMAADEFREKHEAAFKKGVLFKGLVADLKRVETAETKASKAAAEGALGTGVAGGDTENDLMDKRMAVSATPAAKPAAKAAAKPAAKKKKLL